MMRTKLSMRLICSCCGRELECDADSKETRFNFNSAYEAEVVMSIKPCEICLFENGQPVRLLKEALNLLQQEQPAPSGQAGSDLLPVDSSKGKGRD